MVHPGVIVFGFATVVVTGVMIYTMFKEEINDLFEKPSPAGAGYERQRGFAQDDNDDNSEHEQGQSSSIYYNDYELRQRRPRLNEDEDGNEKDPE
ncbi:hypothetical protein BGX27_007213, partial [Mortierella sp. AM989]